MDEKKTMFVVSENSSIELYLGRVEYLYKIRQKSVDNFYLFVYGMVNNTS